uniref:Uncharacterized protein n=1 Tax=Micrurus corallinus TaxID=54390 RepID=A0A2D4F7C0_MICCO
MRFLHQIPGIRLLYSAVGHPPDGAIQQGPLWDGRIQRGRIPTKQGKAATLSWLQHWDIQLLQCIDRPRNQLGDLLFFPCLLQNLVLHLDFVPVLDCCSVKDQAKKNRSSSSS